MLVNIVFLLLSTFLVSLWISNFFSLSWIYQSLSTSWDKSFFAFQFFSSTASCIHPISIFLLMDNLLFKKKEKKEKLLIKWYTVSILFNDIAFSDIQLCRIIIIISFLDLLLYLQFKYAKYMSIIIVVVVVIITYPKIT